MILATVKKCTLGTMILKAFQGEPLNQLKSQVQDRFKSFKVFKPKSSRSESVEIFLLGFEMLPLS